LHDASGTVLLRAGQSCRRFAFAAGVVCGVLGAAYGIAKLLKEH
jgi:hypothetical protein